MTFALTAKSKTKPTTSGKRAAKKVAPTRSIVETLPGLGGQSAIAPSIQPKLKIGEPNDRFEQEADRVADEVMRVPGAAAALNTPVAAQPKFLNLKETNQRPSFTLESKIQSIEGSGQLLPQSIRNFFEPRFRHNFDNVRIHTGRNATQFAQSIQARAFTIGRNIVFNSGEYHPDSDRGKRLVAHELTHVVQQSGKPHSILQRQPSGSDLDLAEPDIGCTIDLMTAIRARSGNREAALRVINCCVSGLPLVNRGCTENLVDAACFLFPDFCRERTRSEQVRCPAGFRPAQSRTFRGKCCREGTVVESDRGCCFTHQITTNAIFPRCCPPPTVPNPERTDCVTLPPPTIFPPIPTPDQPPTTPSTEPRALQPITLYFFFDSTIRRPESNRHFDLLLLMLQAIPRLRAHLIGHASSEGSADYNLRLGQRRADAVRAELIIAGIDSSRIITLSLGATSHAVPEPNIAGRSLSPRVEAIRNQNRRVEVVFFDPGGEFSPGLSSLPLRPPQPGSPTPNLSPPFEIPRLRF